MRSIWQNEEFLGSEKKFHHNKISLIFYLELYKKKNHNKIKILAVEILLVSNCLPNYKDI